VLSFVSKLVALALVVTAVAQERFPARVSNDGQLLELADLTCDKVFLSPNIDTGGGFGGGAYPTTYRYNGATREYFTTDADGHIWSYLEPAGSACATALGSVAAASLPGWGGDWGLITPMNNDGSIVPNVDSFTVLSGLSYDDQADEFVVHWYSTYNDPHNHNNLARFTLEETGHVMTSLGCHAVSGVNNILSNTGIVMIPSSFLTAHSLTGKYWGIGHGGLFAPASSAGPAVFAVAPPSNNACAANTDYAFGTPTTLVKYLNANGGPTCDDLLNDGGPLCGDTTPITRPHAARMAFDDYSSQMYTWTWEPSDGTGWMGWNTNLRLGWYDDRSDGGSKHGILVPFMTPSGAINTTVSAGATPTGTSMRLTAIVMNDGYNIHPGTVLWVESCAPTLEVPTGNAPDDCDTADNGRNFSIIVVDTVNTTTKDITFTRTTTDASGDGVPEVGGKVWGGSVYMWGSPTDSRRTVRAQIYNPARLGEVADSTRDADQVIYAEEGDWCSVLHHLGCPSTGNGIPTTPSSEGLSAGRAAITAVLPDHAAKQIIVAVSAAVESSGVAQTLYYVFDVNSPAPTPQPFPVLLVAGGVAIWSVGGLLARRRAA
jgi:hypothetical protein